MARYQIWNRKNSIITPSGEVFTAAQWTQRYPMTALEEIKTVIGGGVVNGTVCMEFTGMIENYASMGCDFSACETDQDYLTAIEAFEDAQNTAAANLMPSAEERIAAALEAQVMLSLPDEETA